MGNFGGTVLSLQLSTSSYFPGLSFCSSVILAPLFLILRPAILLEIVLEMQARICEAEQLISLYVTCTSGHALQELFTTKSSFKALHKTKISPDEFGQF